MKRCDFKELSACYLRASIAIVLLMQYQLATAQNQTDIAVLEKEIELLKRFLGINFDALTT